MPLFVRTPCAGAELLLLLLWFVIRCCVVMSPCLLGNWPSRNRRKVIKPVSDLISSALPAVSHQPSLGISSVKRDEGSPHACFLTFASCRWRIDLLVRLIFLLLTDRLLIRNGTYPLIIPHTWTCFGPCSYFCVFRLDRRPSHLRCLFASGRSIFPRDVRLVVVDDVGS